MLRRPYPAQALAIMGVSKRWQRARNANVVAECGSGKTSRAPMERISRAGSPIIAPRVMEPLETIQCREWLEFADKL